MSFFRKGKRTIKIVFSFTEGRWGVFVKWVGEVVCPVFFISWLCGFFDYVKNV